MNDSLPAKMIIYLFIIGLASYSCAGHRMIVTHAPSYVSFQEQEKPLQTSDVSKVISHTLGVPSQTEMKWHGLLQGSMFKRPKANVLVTLITQGSPVIELKSKADFPLELDTPGVDVSGLMSYIQGSFLDQNPLLLEAGMDNNMFDIKSEFDVFRKLPNTLRRMSDRLLDADSVIQDHNVGSLNTSAPTDLKLMAELQMIQDVMKTVQTNDNLLASKTPDLYSFTITGVKDISDKHGVDSTKTGDALNLVTDFLNQMTAQFKTIYRDNVVVEIIMVNPPKGHVRKARSLMAVADKNNTMNPYNLAMDYDENYPVAFNIILWLMILLAITYYAVCYSIWNMDPGRDSIIYRMTTTRLKKD